MLQEKEPSDEALSLMAMAPSTHAWLRTQDDSRK